VIKAIIESTDTFLSLSLSFKATSDWLRSTAPCNIIDDKLVSKCLYMMAQQIASQADRSALSSLSDSGFRLRYLYRHLGYILQNGEGGEDTDLIVSEIANMQSNPSDDLPIWKLMRNLIAVKKAGCWFNDLKNRNCRS
jgi:hypothetical protein